MIGSFLKWCTVTLKGSDSKQFPVQQVAFDGNTADAFMIFPYGMSANVSNDALSLLFSVNDDDFAAIATSAKERIKNLKQGEVIFFHPEKKSFLKFVESGDIKISTNSKLSITNDTAELIDLISQLNAAVEAITVNTVNGSTPINNKATLTALQPLIDSFKE